jgi:hypothetical protein
LGIGLPVLAGRSSTAITLRVPLAENSPDVLRLYNPFTPPRHVEETGLKEEKGTCEYNPNTRIFYWNEAVAWKR